MLLHNQRGATVSWEANGQVYEWAPYGACELPDNLVPLIKSEGFPVDVAPVPPKAKAERAAALATESEAALALQRAQKDLADALDVAQEARAAAAAADVRATAVREEADAAKERVLALEEEVRTLRSDAAAFEKLIAESSAKVAKLEAQLKVDAQAKSAPKTKEK